MRILKSQSVVGVRDLNQAKGDLQKHNIDHALNENAGMIHDGSPELANNKVAFADIPDQKSDEELVLSRQLAECESKLRESEDRATKLFHENNSLRAIYDLESGKAFDEQRSAGYKSGLEEGRMAGQLETREISTALSGVLKKLEDDFQVSLIEQKPLILELVFAAISKILGEKYRDQQFIIDIVSKNISALRLRDEIKVTVCPADYKILSDYLTEEDCGVFNQKFRLGSSSVVECGGCIIETDAGGLDARLDVQLNELRKIFLSLYE